MQIELLGKVQRQEPDHLLYTCLAYVRALGVPLYNFRMVVEEDQALARASAATDAGASAATAVQQQQPAAATAGQQAADKHPQDQGGQASHSMRLKFLSKDALLRQGGLVRVSEGGRVWELRQNQQIHMDGNSMAGGAGLQGGGMVAEQPDEQVDEEMWSGSEVDG